MFVSIAHEQPSPSLQHPTIGTLRKNIIARDEIGTNFTLNKPEQLDNEFYCFVF